MHRKDIKLFWGIKMWKIFRCKRGEERFLIPGEHAKGDVVLSSEKGIEILINGIRKALSPGIRILEDEKKVVVQNQREVGGIDFYKKFLEINKNPIYHSESLERFLDSQTNFLNKIVDKILKVSARSVLEEFPHDVIDIMMDTYNENRYGVKCHNKFPRFSIN
ncbi:hypothetical protein FP803_04080, partial [Candidatus Woesearchaeota archaeon]|nr:hypothetical protein [Candidatus Woesearchaeota archaeon]